MKLPKPRPEHVWVLVPFVLALVLLFRTGIVGAPADTGAAAKQEATTEAWMAHVRSESERMAKRLEQTRGSGVPAEMERRVRDLESELTRLRSALGVERERAAILEESYVALDSKFDHVATAARDLLESVAAPAALSASFPTSFSGAAAVPASAPASAHVEGQIPTPADAIFVAPQN